MATQRVAMINSNNTQKNSDYDFSKITKWLLGNKGGVETSSMFTWDNTSKRLSAGADIATAYVLCTRATSSPIPNQKFLAQFEFTGYLDFLNGTDGDKIFVEIKEKLIKDPSLIEDLDSNTSYAQGLGIGEIKIAKSYPSHSNYLPLREIQGGQPVDKRKVISMPALDEVSQRTTTLEEKFETAKPGIDAASQMPEKIRVLETRVNKLTTVNGIRQELDFKVEGRASATWNAPENGLLEYKFSRQGNSGSAALGDMDLPVRSWENIPNYLFVQKGQQIFLSVDNNYRQGLYKIQLTAFIPL